jgi:hypothetical protein
MQFRPLAVLLMVGVAIIPLRAQSIHPRLKAKEVPIGQFTIVASTVEATGKDARNDPHGYNVSEVASQVASAFENAIEAAGWKAAKDVLDPKSLKETSAQENVLAAQKAFAALAAKIQAKPKDVGKGAFTLGDAARALAPHAQGGLLVFAHATAVLDSITSASASPGEFSIRVTPKNKVKAWYALVDPISGDVLLAFPAEGKGGGVLITRGLEDGIKAALGQIPR